MTKIKSFELQLASSLDICNDPVKKLVANTANRIRKNRGLPELSLAFWEEDLHPRGEHGRFASKGSARGSNSSNGSYERESYYPRERQGYRENSRFGEFEGRTYDREQVQREMSQRESNANSPAKSNARKFFDGLGITIGGMAISHFAGAAAATLGAGFLATMGAGALGFILGGALSIYGMLKMAKAIVVGTAYVLGLYGTKTAIGVGKVVSEPFAEAGRGIYEGATS